MVVWRDSYRNLVYGQSPALYATVDCVLFQKVYERVSFVDAMIERNRQGVLSRYGPLPWSQFLQVSCAV
eukprot:5154491-Amphidinium_carterae.1